MRILATDGRLASVRTAGASSPGEELMTTADRCRDVTAHQPQSDPAQNIRIDRSDPGHVPVTIPPLRLSNVVEIGELQQPIWGEASPGRIA